MLIQDRFRLSLAFYMQGNKFFEDYFLIQEDNSLLTSNEVTWHMSLLYAAQNSRLPYARALGLRVRKG